MPPKRRTNIGFGATALWASSVIFVPIAVALPEDADQPIHIRADNAEIDQQQGLAIYRGDVRVEQGTLRVTADEMTVTYVDQKVVRITAKGNPAHYQQQIEVGRENVTAHSSVIIYFTQEERLDLLGDAYLIQEGSEITGDLITYDIVAGKVDATAEKDERIRMILQPAVNNATSDDSDGG
ncbi:MAG: lipopolysaccharide transport periplasmic protein LptA [Gammaproteobacteria bacterium]|nr:lipopolysaccharide transport periplasmic protein LptA [Gammaproteobacteria bacterium]